MRNITHHDYWSAVRDHMGTEAYADRVKSFSGAFTFQSPEEAEAYWRAFTIPILLHACEINGCKNPVSERAYLEETLQSYLALARVFPRLLADTDAPGVQAEVQELRSAHVLPEYRRIAAAFDERHACHSDPEGGYVCYCEDES